jgi:hypothetical protein
VSTVALPGTGVMDVPLGAQSDARMFYRARSL